MRIFETQDGSHSIFSEKYGVSYHSKYGAVQETQHVFINAALRPKALKHKELSVLEIGFGTGLNAFMSYLEAKKFALNLQYTAIEAYPISFEEAQLLNFPKILKKEEEASFFLNMHRAGWGESTLLDEHFTINKQQQLFEDIDYRDQFDIIYYDAFAPNAQPELWEQGIMSKMFKALKRGGFLVTYCAKGVVKRVMKSVGFEIEALKGPPGKREMTRAVKP